MTISKSRVHIHLLFALTVVGLSTYGNAQNTYLTDSNKTGIVPYGSYVGSEFENVDLASGGLNLNIPLLARKGRGIDLRYTLRYSSKFWGLEFGLHDPITRLDHYAWRPVNGGGNFEIDSGDAHLEFTEQFYQCYVPVGPGTVCDGEFGICQDFGKGVIFHASTQSMRTSP